MLNSPAPVPLKTKTAVEKKFFNRRIAGFVWFMCYALSNILCVPQLPGKSKRLA